MATLPRPDWLSAAEADIDREVAFYHARMAAERRSQEQEDDRAADAVRLMAPDVLAGAQGDATAPRASLPGQTR